MLIYEDTKLLYRQSYMIFCKRQEPLIWFFRMHPGLAGKYKIEAEFKMEIVLPK